MLDEACRSAAALDGAGDDFAGKHYQLTDAWCEPKPLQDPMPLWIGGSGEQRTLRIVAEHATGWNTFHAARRVPAQARRPRASLRGRRSRPGEIRKQIVIRAALGDSEGEADDALRERAEVLRGELEAMRRDWIVATPEQCVERLAPYVTDFGVSDLILFARPPADLPTMGSLAREVGPALRAL